MNLEEFAESGLRNTHIREDGITIYVRRSTKYLHNADFELATINADVPGSGSLTAFMNKYSDKYTFFVECIHERRLVPFFERFGYRQVEALAPDCSMIAPNCTLVREMECSPGEMSLQMRF